MDATETAGAAPPPGPTTQRKADRDAGRASAQELFLEYTDLLPPAPYPPGAAAVPGAPAPPLP